jgi:hypothetical protein
MKEKLKSHKQNNCIAMISLLNSIITKHRELLLEMIFRKLYPISNKRFLLSRNGSIVKYIIHG